MMLVSVVAGYDEIMTAYKHAVDKRYRFMSFGDGMLIKRHSWKDYFKDGEFKGEEA